MAQAIIQSGVRSLPGVPAAAPAAKTGAREVAPVPTTESLYREHRLAVSRWAARLGGPRVDVADVVQEVFLIVHRKLPAFRPEAKVTTWLYQITENVVRHRRRRARVGALLDRVLRRDGLAARPAPQGEAALALARLEQGEGRARVYQVLDRLTERHRSALILYELEGLSGEEIAERLSAKAATVWVWLHRGRAEFVREFRRLEARDG